ncbi:hypothetical protein FRB95_014278 [Tulasnella sp. JGI-2019a]|nr:hypothetical protein FRB95_014278 [Tulasnella sp. JGI-2019a]
MRGILSTNAYIANVIYMITVIISYAASSAVVLHSSIFPTFLKFIGSKTPSESYSIISFLPLLVLGSMLAIEVIIGFVSFFNTTVHTWSSRHLGVTSAAYGVPKNLRFDGPVALGGALGPGLLYLTAVKTVVALDLHFCGLVTLLVRDEMV